jgi:hypothetical protein
MHFILHGYSYLNEYLNNYYKNNNTQNNIYLIIDSGFDSNSD